VSEPLEYGAPEDDRLVPHVFFLDERESRPVNPNTPEGELRNIAAFAAGVSAAPAGHRLLIKLVVWLLLLGIAMAILAGVASGVRTF
jgi:hypothetical protein